MLILYLVDVLLDVCHSPCLGAQAWGPFEAQPAVINSPFESLPATLGSIGEEVVGVSMDSLPADAISYYEVCSLTPTPPACCTSSTSAAHYT